MRNSAARFLSLLLVVLLVFAMSTTGLAVEGKPLLTLQDASGHPVRGGKVTVQVHATVPGVVADGKITVRYPGGIPALFGGKGRDSLAGRRRLKPSG